MIFHECENCGYEFDKGEEVLTYDGCYWCSEDCVKEHIWEMNRQEVGEVMLP